LILCEGWRKATAVYEHFRKVTKNVRSIRVQIVYGGGAEDECIPGLINGCEVLIATLPCLLRMLRKKCTRLNRLCHLVFDDADILAEEQTESVKELMREYYGRVSSTKPYFYWIVLSVLNVLPRSPV
jgi:superfamily II DNA/RNA helicase